MLLGLSVVAPQGVQVLQDLTILSDVPLVSGMISPVQGRLQERHGPRILQPYYDLAKLFRKEMVVTRVSSRVCLAGPVVAFGSYHLVPLLTPVRQRTMFVGLSTCR